VVAVVKSLIEEGADVGIEASVYILLSVSLSGFYGHLFHYYFVSL
jgi:hypothetical protein